MKKLSIMVLLMVLLSGCGTQDCFETVSDTYLCPVSAQTKKVSVTLPLEAAAPVAETDSGRIYLCKDYEITVQTMASGDLDKTVRKVSGYSAENLTLIETAVDDLKRYEFVWASAGEVGDCVGRGAILDDGNYHYVLTVLGDAETAEKHADAWKALFQSFSLG